MDPILQYVLGYIDSLPQDSFDEIRRTRAAVPVDNLPVQRLLSMEDRRAYAREQVNEKGLFGALNMGVSIPAEQAAKAVVAAPVIGPAVQKVLDSIGIPDVLGRSGFHDPVMNVKAGYSGVLQGLDDIGMFGRGRQ